MAKEEIETEKTLERVMRKKVKPIIDHAMQRFLGVKIDELSEDISDKIESRPLLSYDVKTALSFKAAKKLFKKQFLTKIIQAHYGNISEVAKVTHLNRRSIHRAISQLGIDVETVRREMLRPTYFQREAVDNILRKTFDDYKKILHPDKLQQIYNHVPELTDDIIKEIPIREMTWKEAESQFEKQFISKILKQYNGNITRSAKKMKLRYETVIRKIKKLSISAA